MKSAIDNLDFVPEIMVVDDSSDCRQLLVDLLQEHGCQVRVADSGERAIKAIQIKQPDLVLLDIKMAKLDGFDVCEYLKEHPVTEKIPIIFISASDDSDSKVNGFYVGGSDYITKPFDPGEVLSRVTHQLKSSQARSSSMILMAGPYLCVYSVGVHLDYGRSISIW